MARDSLHRGSRSSRWAALLMVAAMTMGLAACGKSPEERLADARAAMAEKDFTTAVIELKNVLQEDPNVPEARLLLAQSAFALGDPQTAEKELERAYELGADAAAQRAMHYRIQLALGNFEEVSVSLSQEGGSDGLTAAEVATFKGNADLGLRKPTEAEASFRAALEEDPGYADAKVGLVGALQAQRRNEEAEAVVADLVESHPEQPAGWLIRAQMALRDGRLEPARDDFQQAVETAGAAPDRTREFIALVGLTESQIGLNDLEGADRSVAALRRIAPGSPITLKTSAKVHFAKQDYPAARGDLQKVLAANNDDATALFLLGAVYLAEGDPDQAELNLARAVNLAPGNLAARKLLAQAQLRRADPDAAVEALAPLLESEAAPDLQTSYLASQALFRTGETDQAIELLEQSHAADPTNMDVAMSLGAGYLAQQRIDDAVDLFESIPPSEDYRRELMLAVAYAARDESDQAQAQIDRILAENPDDNQALILVSEYYFAAGRTEEAKGYLNQVVAADPGNNRARIGLARISLQAGDLAETRRIMEGVLEDDPDNLQARLVLGDIAIREKRYADARGFFEPAAAEAPNAVQARASLAVVYMYLGLSEEAEETAAEAYALAPEDPRVLLVNGVVAIATNKAREATGYLSTLTRIEPQAAVGWFQLARAQYALNEAESGRASLDKALELAPDYLEAVVLDALLFLNEGDYDAALARARRMQSTYPDLAAPYVLEGEILFRAERFDEAAVAFEQGFERQPTGPVAIRIHLARRQAGGDAIDLLETWLDEHPDDQRVSLIIAEYRQQSGDTDAAIDVYQQAIEVDRNNPVALNNMAWLLHEEGDERAEEFARRAHELRPDLPQIKDTLGWILVNKGQLEEGRALLEEADEALPNNGDIRYHLAVALEKSGEREKSSEMLREILAGEQDFESRTDAEQMLAEISAQ